VKITITYSPEHPIESDDVTVTFTIDDPDGRVDTDCWDPWADGINSLSCQRASDAQPTRYGPWTPPAPEPGHDQRSFTHRYAAGTYTLKLGVVVTCGREKYDPYASAGYQEVQMVVAAA
jgi:hypothetical protein